MNSRTAFTLGGVLLVAATLTACGSSNNSSFTSPSAPSGTVTPTPTPTPSPDYPGPSPSPAPAPAAADVVINITGMNDANSFSPNPATVKVGQTVSWYNADSIAHDPTADGGAFDAGLIAPGATSAPVAMATVGTIGYHCSVHPSMVGSLNVTQ